MKPVRLLLCIIPLAGYALSMVCLAASLAVALVCMTACKWLRK